MAPVNLELTVRLVDAAARILVEDGPGGLSLRKVAAAAGVSTMPVYTLFGDKQGLLDAMHREGFRRLGLALAAVPRTDDALADLVALGFAYREAALASPHLYGLMFTGGFGHTEAADATYRPLVTAVARCQSEGVFTGTDPEPVALHLWALAHGMVSLELSGKVDGAAFAEQLGYAGLPFLAR
ncbi:TetR/AcrR family transcriptional regulator [Dactylosporangium vinaceum]|uniref:TetR/AcrR family transcriptional regulator n=1 Tax=Dactylosporangium vinaceum TaxID=53362 RepID=A0ABV5MFF1_9ACTN|nr:TetR/AcrR family transcriptional regulator [Dactylosporangium vinaceum]UAB98730.1 TetR/AcrR family transcriptional regulator [Dactylosporangium vinaceum]